ncbi:carboxymuconolactone decarboxylase family protein [Mucilaginibacter ginsenosidivorans]|uniref:Carboxymuconolactone decarboxylase family protein n=1 Tax=Mucilaginibacter ginsenosidivorans TaxID=398053 RepID=A0A5B8UXG1_9SPHI|nr:carboxymuconolactone decarboxylase family protein [Mucilaginibacter ginsenosidivorans]QEC63355.1 carboxymuconolactone decarboxylase family protein [Mucilaginibacter ginsenosidivorans]
MKTFSVPTREQVSPANQAIFDNLQKAIGMVPNLYAAMAHSEHGLGNYIAFQSGKSSLRAKEREIINLVVSQVNGCIYCLSAHTVLGKMNGLTDDQLIEIRKGSASFDAKLDALVKLVKSITENKGRVDSALVDNFYAAGYNEGNLVDAIMIIGDKTIMNYLHNLTGIAVDFPLAPSL